MKFAFYSNIIIGFICALIQYWAISFYVQDEDRVAAGLPGSLFAMLILSGFGIMSCALFIAAYKIKQAMGNFKNLKSESFKS